MAKIKTLYFIHQTHTDIGYTDHQNALFRQHLEFIDQAIELCEATYDYPPEAQFKWTCEAVGIVEKYVQSRPAAQIDRLVRLNQAGRIAISALGYNWTPLLSPAQMVRSLHPVMRLRRDFGLRVTSAMQGDVNGASWLWAELLPAIGVGGFTMSINSHRGRRPRPGFNAFWWQGPGGGKLLTYSGLHYSTGIIFYGLGTVAQAAQALPPLLEKLEASDDYPFDFLFMQATNPNLPDNGGPYAALSSFVREWNEAGQQPAIEFTTVDGFLAMLRDRYAAVLPTWRGDWTDWWADGVASSAYETSVARTTSALLPALDLLAAQTDALEPALIEAAYQNLALYGEHTWGAFNSISAPRQPFVRAQFNQKAHFAYNGYVLAHELLARGTRRFSHRAGLIPEGDVVEQWAAPGESPPSMPLDRYLVINPLGWERSFSSPTPPDGLSTAPYHFLDAHFIENARDGYPQSIGMPDAIKSKPEILHATLPAFSYQCLTPQPGPGMQANLGEGRLENEWYRLQIDPHTGGLQSWFDKVLGRELAATNSTWRLGQYVYEWVDSPKGRQAIYAEDFSTEAIGKWVEDTPFRREGAEQCTLGPARQTNYSAWCEVFLHAPGAQNVRVRYSLPHHEKALHIDVVVDKTYVTKPESIYILFPFALQQPAFHLDLNGVPLTPEAEQIPGSCRSWYGIQRWAEVGDEGASIVVSPLDAPLIQVGGIQTGRWDEHLSIQEATLVSWPVQNHWTTNFQAGQSGELLFRYRLTSMKAYDPASASRFAAEQLTPPIIARVFGEPAPSGQFLKVTPEGAADVQIKPAEDGRGLIVRAFNLTASPQQIQVSFPLGQVTGALDCSPIEEDRSPLPLSGGTLTLELPPRSPAQAKVLLAL